MGLVYWHYLCILAINLPPLSGQYCPAPRHVSKPCGPGAGTNTAARLGMQTRRASSNVVPQQRYEKRLTYYSKSVSRETHTHTPYPVVIGAKIPEPVQPPPVPKTHKMISATALPDVTSISAPIVSPRFDATLSVAWLSRPASGTMATQLTAKTTATCTPGDGLDDDARGHVDEERR